MEEKYIELDKVADKLNLTNLTPQIDISKRKIYQANVNRPSLQFAGYFEYMDAKRILIVGRGEAEYLKTVPKEIRQERYTRLFAEKFPAMIIARGIEPESILLEEAIKNGTPVLSGQQATYKLTVSLIQYLSEMLAPSESIYGVLVDVYGEGIIITGESGVGKSETAIELIKRGHRLVADDVIEVSKINEEMLIGKSPKMTQHLIELRGIGVIDAKSLFGVESIRESKQIDMIIHLEEWDFDKIYDRLGLTDEYQDILGIPVVKHSVPVRPGRNLAIIIETAAVNNRQKKMGYNAALELCNRVSEEISKKQSPNGDNQSSE